VADHVKGKRGALLWVAQVAAVAVAYYGAGRLGLSLALPPGHATAVWPPSGIALAAVLLIGYRVWPGIWLGAVLVNVQDLIDGAAGLDLVKALAVAFAIGAGSTAQALLAAALVHRWTEAPNVFDRARDVFKFTGIAALAYPVGAIVGVTSLCLAGFVAWGAYTDNLRTWWLGDLTGVLIVTPLILVWCRPTGGQRVALLETVNLLALASVTSAVIFWGVLPDGDDRYSLAFLLIPFVVWAAFRLGQRTVTLTTATISGIALIGAAEGVGPFSGGTLNSSLLTLQAFVGVVAITGLALAAAVSERGRAEESLRRIVEAAPNALITVDAAGRIKQVNTHAEALFGYTREELLGQPVERLVPDRFHAQHRRDRQAFFAEAQARAMGAGRDLFGLRKDGSQVPVEIGLNPVTTSEGTFVVASIIDITERKQMEEEMKQYAEELARSNTELEQFAYVTSHDLQEPLRMVISYCGLLQRRYKGRLDQDADEFIEFAVDGANRMRALVQDLLSYGQVGSNGHKQTSIDCSEALERALVSLQSAITENNARVTHGPLPTVIANPTEIEQLFQNLVGNAIKFHGDDPPEVKVHARQEDGTWQLSVRDNGIGIEPQYADKIFEVFQRLHRRKDYAGTGVGLAICRRIVERNGGRIWFDSEPGKGSTFYFTLPRGRLEETDGRASEPTSN
jgi:PAS domain S-box-containing protein